MRDQRKGRGGKKQLFLPLPLALLRSRCACFVVTTQYSQDAGWLAGWLALACLDTSAGSLEVIFSSPRLFCPRPCLFHSSTHDRAMDSCLFLQVAHLHHPGSLATSNFAALVASPHAIPNQSRNFSTCGTHVVSRLPNLKPLPVRPVPTHISSCPERNRLTSSV